jgi:hypothetical protein
VNENPRRVEGDTAGAEAVTEFQQKHFTASTSPLQSPGRTDHTSDLSRAGCAFLRFILPDTGPYVAFRLEGQRRYNEFASTVEELWELIKRADDAGYDAYHACAGYKVARNNRKNDPAAERLYGRTKHNVRGAKAFWLDVDAGCGKPYPDADAAWRAIIAFCHATGLPLPLPVLSGFGLHAYWTLSLILDPETWARYARGLQSLCVKHHLQVDPARTTDISSVLRTPGTHHRKSGDRRWWDHSR